MLDIKYLLVGHLFVWRSPILGFKSLSLFWRGLEYFSPPLQVLCSRYKYCYMYSILYILLPSCRLSVHMANCFIRCERSLLTPRTVTFEWLESYSTIFKWFTFSSAHSEFQVLCYGLWSYVVNFCADLIS